MAGTISDWERERFEREASLEIGSLPEFEPERKAVPVPPTTETLSAEPCVLMERSCGGWSTSLEWHPATGLTCTVRQGFDAIPFVFTVPEGASPLDVFEHPYVYDPR